MYYLFLYLFYQITILCAINLLAFLLFEILPISLKKENTISKNFKDLIIYQFGMSFLSLLFGIVIYLLFLKFNFIKGYFDITDLNIFLQIFVVYLMSEFIIYMFHLVAHKWKIPLISKSHLFHHMVTEDLQWVNSKKEHPFIVFLFVLVFCFVFYTIFKTDFLVKIICINTFVFLQALSHFRIPFTVKYLEWFFLLPESHHKHHKQRGGPYGVSLSIFDNIFGTNN